jgi:hypothetical protein
LSDIEHNRRRPSERLLRSIARELSGAGATFEDLEQLVTGIDPDLRDWVARTPGVRRLLRAVKDSGQAPNDLLQNLSKLTGAENARKSRSRHPGEDRRSV